MLPRPSISQDEQATGLILRTRPLTESSLIVHWLTHEAGRVATVAKGARRPKSPFKGKLDLFFCATFSFRRSRRSELHTLREVSLKELFESLRTDILKLQQAAYATVLIERTTETDTPIPEIHDLVLGFVRHLDKQPALPLNVFAFEMRLLEQLGLAPDLAQSRLSPGAKALLQHAASRPWESLLNLKASPAQETEIARFLNGFLLHNLGWVPSGRQAAAQMPNA